MLPRSRQKLGGLAIAVIGAAVTGWSWYTALRLRYFYVKASVLFPAFFVLGLGMVFLPGYREERERRGEDISRLEGWRLITPRWWTIIIVAIVAGGTNYILLSKF